MAVPTQSICRSERTHRPRPQEHPHRRHRSNHRRRTAGRWILRLMGLAMLLILPGRAVSTLSNQFGVSWILGYLALVSIITALINRADKRKAVTDQWRTPESTLHFLELIGGWPAAFVIQHIIRHKTAKSSYQSTFWLIVILHQYLAIDFVQGWTWTRWVYETVRPLIEVLLDGGS